MSAGLGRASEFDVTPIEKFGSDHWSTFAYVESVCVEKTKFMVEFNPRMRQCRRHFRLLQEAGKRSGCGLGRGIPMDHEKHGTRLFGGSTIAGHDDWHCTFDLIDAGLLIAKGGDKNSIGAEITLTEDGYRMLAALRRHKCEGGNFAGFRGVKK